MTTHSCYRSILLLAVGLVIAAGGCDCGDDESSVDDTESPVVDEETERASDDERLEEVFGLPLPPDHQIIRDEGLLVRVSTGKDLEEIEDFFATNVVDAEVIDTGSRIRLVPLRPHSPEAEARLRAGPGSGVVINYRQPASADNVAQGPPIPDEDQTDESGDETGDDQEDSGFGVGDDLARDDSEAGEKLPPLGERPDWLNDLKGEPVELETRDGEKLAPGARWGEPYTPPEGSPLDQERFRHNFGRPFGDWR